MKTLKVEHMGTKVQGIRLRGDKRDPEPEHVRIVFPGGDVDVVRTTAGDYWVHVRVDGPADEIANDDARSGKLVDARLDVRGKHASECNAGNFAHPDLYHLAVRVARAEALSEPTYVAKTELVVEHADPEAMAAWARANDGLPAAPGPRERRLRGAGKGGGQ